MVVRLLPDCKFSAWPRPFGVSSRAVGTCGGGRHVKMTPYRAISALLTLYLKAAEVMAKNVLGTDLQDCSHDPLTGFFRDGCCHTGSEDVGLHIVCSEMTEEFLAFSKSVGNDLSTPHPEFGFPGLKPGNRWCLCALRWKEALEAGVAPAVVLEATHISTLEFVDLEDLQEHAVEG